MVKKKIANYCRADLTRLTLHVPHRCARIDIDYVHFGKTYLFIFQFGITVELISTCNNVSSQQYCADIKTLNPLNYRVKSIVQTGYCMLYDIFNFFVLIKTILRKFTEWPLSTQVKRKLTRIIRIFRFLHCRLYGMCTRKNNADTPPV